MDEYETFESPKNSSTGKYPNNARCYWNILVDTGKTINLYFNADYFRIEKDNTCSYDFVRVNNLDGSLVGK